MDEDDESATAPTPEAWTTEIERGGDLAAVVDVVVRDGGLHAAISTVHTWGLTSTDSVAAVGALVEAARARGLSPVTIRGADPLVRTMARAAGFTGALREDLALELGTVTSAGIDQEELDVEGLIDALAELLPGVTVHIDRGGWTRRIARRFETGVRGSTRISAARGAATAAVVVPLRPDLMVEAVAAALDTTLAISTRLGALARKLPPVVFGISGLEFAEGRVSGTADPGRVSINLAHVSITACDELIRRRAEAAPPGRSFRPTCPPEGARFELDSTIAHELGHCVDHLGRSGRLSDSTEFRTRMGQALGVRSVELALRGCEAGAAPEWQRAFRDLVDQVSDYATTNGVELFAEIFAAWFEAKSGSVTEEFNLLMNEQFPSPGARGVGSR